MLCNKRGCCSEYSAELKKVESTAKPGSPGSRGRKFLISMGMTYTAERIEGATRLGIMSKESHFETRSGPVCLPTSAVTLTREMWFVFLGSTQDDSMRSIFEARRVNTLL